MGNPSKPAELKLMQGNPGKRAMRLNDAIAPLDYGYVEPIRPLGVVGKQFWDSVFGAGELWISIKTDTQLVQMACELLDRREKLREVWETNPTDRPTNMSLLETEKQIINAFSLMGFSPSDRTRLGLVSAKTKSKLEELLAKKAEKANAQ
jgi:hypothetical protein